MQQSDDRHQGPRRPSLFTEEPAQPAEDRGILSQLDGKKGAPARPAHRSRHTGKIVGGVLGLGVVAGGLVWAFGYSDDDLRPVTAQVAPPAAAQPAPGPVLAAATPSAAAQASELAMADKTAPADVREVSAATILDTTTAGDHPAQPNDELTKSLSKSLESPAKAGPKDELTAAFDRPPQAGKRENTAKAHDRTAKDKDSDKASDKARDKRKAERKAEAARKERVARDTASRPAKKHSGHGSASADSDVTLLEALMSRVRPASKAKGAKKSGAAAHCAPVEGEDGTQHAADCKAAG